MKGGKAIASGGYGCVFSPALKCKTGNRYDGISKLLKNHAAKDEFDETKDILPILKKISHFKNYILLPESICKPSELEQSDLEQFDDKCSKFDSAKSNIDKYTILNMSYGGSDLEMYFKSNKLGSNFSTINNNLIKLIKNAVQVFNNHNLVHADIKGKNILVDNDLTCRIIDWGLAFRYSCSSTKKIDTECEWRPVQFNIPCSNILFSSFYINKLAIHFASRDKKKSLTVEEVSNVIQDNFETYKLQYGNGHIEYTLFMFEVVLKNLNRGISPKKAFFDYIAKSVVKFYDEVGYFNHYKYFYEVYAQNCDIWGILTCYFNLLELTRSRFEFKNGNSDAITNFRKEVSTILYKYMIDHADKVISLKHLMYDLKSLNNYFDTPVVKNGSTIQHKSSLKTLHSKTPLMETNPPSMKEIQHRIDHIKSLSKSNKHMKTLNKRAKRCQNGTRRNKKTGNCESSFNRMKTTNKRTKRCQNGTRRNKKNGNCEKKLVV
jgi:serine/threonine-protein kinase RIO1